MNKSKIINNITDNIEKIDASIIRVYGVPNGVGYDMNINITWAHSLQWETLKAHAVRQSWAAIGHLRPNNPYYQYSGSCDVYRDRVITYWETGGAIAEYLGRMSKSDLLQFASDRGIKLND